MHLFHHWKKPAKCFCELVSIEYDSAMTGSVIHAESPWNIKIEPCLIKFNAGAYCLVICRLTREGLTETMTAS